MSVKVLGLTLFLLFVYTFAQGQAGDIPLKPVLDSLESIHDITFTYLDENISNVQLSAYPPLNDLEAALKFLSISTDLNFQQLQAGYIAISPKVQETKTSCMIIRAADSGEPLEGATITGQVFFGVADSQGKVILSTENEKELLVRYVGYQPQLVTLEATQTPCLSVYLVEQAQYLEEVTIQNYLVKGIDKRVGGALQMHPSEVKLLPGMIEPDILHSLQQLPGIQSVNETVSNINVRGGTNDQNLVRWDGIKMYQTGHFFGLISAFNPYITQNVQLIKNGSPAALHEGVSSTIDIQTFDEVNKDLVIGAGVNMINADILAKIPVTDDLALHISGRRSITGFVETPTFTNYFDRAFVDSEVLTGSGDAARNEDFRFYDYSAKLLYNISDHDELRVSYLSIFNEIQVEETDQQAGQTSNRTSFLDQANRAGTIRYKRQWNEAIKTSISASLSDYILRSVNFDIPNNQRFLQENEVLDFSVHTNLNAKLNSVLFLEGGYQFNEIGVSNLNDLNNPTIRQKIKEVLRSHHPFLELNYRSESGKTIASGGVRGNYFDKFDRIRIEPRLTINQLLTNELSVELLAEMKSQVTTQIINFQTDFLGVESRRWVLVNENDIPLITSSQVSLGLNYQKQNLLISLEGYVKEVDGIITSSQGFHDQFEFVRTAGSYSSAGFDLLQNLDIGKYDFWVNYSYSETNYNFSSLTPSQFPSNLDIRHSIATGLSTTYNKIELAAGINVRSGLPFTPVRQINGELAYGSPNSERTPLYFRPDISFKYHFGDKNGWHGQLGFSLWNAIDRDNIVLRYYQLSNDQLREFNEEALHITPNVMLRVGFN